MKVFADRDFQEACNGLLAKETKKGLFAKPSAEVPSPEDYRELGQKHADSLSRWEQWGSEQCDEVPLYLDRVVTGAYRF